MAIEYFKVNRGLTAGNVTLDAASGNISGSNIIVAGAITAASFSGTFSGPAVTVTASAQPNITSVGTLTSVSSTGNITGAYFIGNGSQLTGLPAGYANADVAAYLPTYTGNLASLQGNVTTTANISGAHFIGNGSRLSAVTGANVTGQVANALVAGTVYTAAQPNITSVGTLTNLDVAGNAVVSGNLVVNGNTIQVNIEQLNVQDPIIGLGRGANNTPLTTNDGRDRGTEMWYYSGSEQAAFVGYQNSTGNIIAASNISVTNEIVTVNNYGNFVAGNVIGAAVSASGNITGAYFVGNGSQLTGLPESGLSWTTQANAAPSSPSPGDFWYDAYTGVKYQYINDGTSNIWVDQSYPSAFSTLTVVANATVGGELGVTGNTAVSGAVSAAGNITGAYFVGNGSQLTGLPQTYSNANVAAYLPTYTGNITGGNIIVTGLASLSSVTKTGASGVGNIGSSSSTFDTVFAKATSAQYADLAEIYSADQAYEPGTVLVFGGDQEVTVSNISHDIRAAGVVSTQPAYVMNSHSPGVAVALTGRVPCRVRGPVAKGQQLVNIEPGIAGAVDFAQYRPGCVIGKSLEHIQDSDVHVIEIAVGRY